MKTRRLFFTIYVVMLIVSGSVMLMADDGEISWLRNIEEAKSVALKQNKIIMVDIYTDWCHWCKELDEKVFSDPSVVASSKKVVSLKINAEDRAHGQNFARKYGISSYPTILFINGKGQEVDRIGGFLPAPGFLQQLERVVEGRDTFLSLIQGYEKGKLSILQACNLANRFLKRNITGKAGEILATIDVSSLTDEVELENVLLTKFNYLFVTGDHESAEKNLEKYISEFTHREMYPDSLYYMVVTKSVMGKKEEAQKYLDELKENYSERKEMISRAEQIILQI